MTDKYGFVKPETRLRLHLRTSTTLTTCSTIPIPLEPLR
jgi:hypothetical protein